MFNFPDISVFLYRLFKSQFAILLIAVSSIITPATAISQGKNTSQYDGVGRAATANEVKAWDIDVRPDFKGLPKGMGSV